MKFDKAYTINVQEGLEKTVTYTVFGETSQA